MNNKNKQVKILLATIDFPPQTGGVARYLNSVCQHIPAERLLVLATPYLDVNLDTQGFDQEQKYEIKRVPLLSNGWLWPKWLPSFYYLWRYIRKYRVRHVQISHVLPLGTVVYLLNKILDFDYSVYIHGMDILSAKEYKRKKLLAIKVLNNAKFIIVNSSFTKNILIELGIKDEKIKIIYPGLDLLDQKVEISEDKKQELLNKYHLNDKRIIVSLGRLVKRKGFDLCLQALPEVIKKVPNIHYVILGAGEDEARLTGIIRQLGLTQYVTMAGRVSEQDKNKWLSVCHLFVNPARQIGLNDVEGFGIVYLEANYFAKPVIGGKSGGVTEAIIDGQTGLLCDPENGKDLADKILYLLENSDKAELLGKQGFERVMNDFYWSDQVKKIIDLIDYDGE